MESSYQSFDGVGRRQRVHLPRQMKRSSDAQPDFAMQMHGVRGVCRRSVI